MAHNLVLLYESSPIVSKGISEFLRESSIDLTLKVISYPADITAMVEQLEPRLLLFGTSQTLMIGVPELDRLLDLCKNKRCEVIGVNYAISAPEVLTKFPSTISITDTKETLLELIEKNLIEEEELELKGSKVFLTPREEEVIRYLAIGMSNKEIADKMSISSHTVISHRKNITQKLGVKSVSAITIYAVVNKLVSEEDYKKVQ